MKPITTKGWLARDDFFGDSHTKIYLDKPRQYIYRGEFFHLVCKTHLPKNPIKKGECIPVEITIKMRKK